MSSLLTAGQLTGINRVNVAFAYLNYVNARLALSVLDTDHPLPTLMNHEDQALHAALTLIEDVITGRVDTIAKVAEPPQEPSTDAIAQPTT